MRSLGTVLGIFLALTGGLSAQDANTLMPAPAITNRAEPVYPPDALKAVPEGGTIHLFVEIDGRGKVLSVDSFGPSMDCKDEDPRVRQLQAAAEDAVKRSTFTPATRAGVTVEAPLIITYTIPAQPAAAEPTEPGSRKVVRGSVVNGRAISMGKPSYPSKARKYRIAGPVEAKMLIDEQGDIIRITSVNGHPLLLKGAADAACRSKYTPTLLSGQPVKVGAVIRYNFVP